MLIALKLILFLNFLYTGRSVQNGGRRGATSERLITSNIENRSHDGNEISTTDADNLVVRSRAPNEAGPIIGELTIRGGLSANLCFRKCLAQLKSQVVCSDHFRSVVPTKTWPLGAVKFFIKNRSLRFNSPFRLCSVSWTTKSRLKRNLNWTDYKSRSKGINLSEYQAEGKYLPSINTKSGNQMVTLSFNSPNGLPVWSKNRPDGDSIRSAVNHSVPFGSILKSELVLNSTAKSEDVFRNPRDLRLMSYRRGDSKPHLLFTPIEQTVSPGSPVSMKCSAMGSPIPVISWTRDGSSLIPSLRTRIGSHIFNHEVVSFVNITNVMTRDGGTFSCLATNAIGSTAYSTRLNVYGPPFVRPMVNLTAIAGEDAVIRCPVGGYPLPVLKWQFNGNKLTPSMRVNILPNNTLLVRNINEKDQGRYSCIATGRRGRTAMSETYIIIINPPVIEEFSFARDLLEGRRTHLTCMVTSGDLPISIKWMKDGIPLNHDPDLKQKLMSDYSMSLLFEKLDERHSGNYTCVASNAAASTNYTAPLKVKFSPKWIKQPSDISLSVGASIRLECIAKGEPEPNIKWMKTSEDNNYEVFDRLPTKQLPSDKGALLFSKIKKKHAGSYTCQISNGIEPNLVKIVNVNVNAGATILSPGGDVSGPIGRSVEMVCEAAGDPPIQVIWMKEYTRIMPSDRVQILESEERDGLRSVLRLESLTSFDRGDYTCEVVNNHGRKSQLFTLIVLEPPTALKSIVIAEISSKHVKLSWQPEKKVNYLLQYKEQINGKPWEESAFNVTIQQHTAFYELSYLKPFTAYAFRIFAMNDLGVSPPSDVLEFQTNEEAPSGEPQDVIVASIEPRSFTISWRSPELSTHNGLLRGYIISIKEQNMNENVQLIVRPIHHHDRNDVESYTVRGLATNSLYEVAIKVFNNVGHGPLSSPRVVQETLQEAPFCSPIGLFCKSDHTSGIRVWWETPSYACENAKISGYSIVATPTAYIWGNIGGSSTIEVTTTNLEKNLPDLAANSNISIVVRSFNHFGFSPPSKYIFCQTSEDVPNRVTNVRATATTDGSIIVSWNPSMDDHSALQRYTVFYEENGLVNKAHHDGKDQMWQILKEFNVNSRINVWVTAISSAGEGLPSEKILVVSTSSTTYGPIAIGTNPIIYAPTNAAVTIGCTSFGVPHPTIEWYHRGRKVVSDETHHLLPGGDLHVTAKQSANYSCKAVSANGVDTFMTSLNVLSPPSAPFLKVTDAGFASLNVSVSFLSDGGSPILGYFVHHRQNSQDWKHIEVPPNPVSTLSLVAINDLKCGSSTQVYAESWTSQGTSPPSKVSSIFTKGSSPPNPDAAEIIAVNTSCSLLSLYRWPENGCLIQYWGVEIKSEDSDGWNSIYESLGRDTADLAMCDYSHHSDHYVRLTAYSEAGKTAIAYKIRFGKVEKGWISAEKIEEINPETDELKSQWFDAHIIAGMLSSALLTLAVIICIVVIVKRYHYDRKISLNHKEDQSTFSCPTNNSHYHTIEKREIYENDKNIHKRTKSRVSIGSFNAHTEEIYPYATFSPDKFEDTNHYGLSLYSNSDSPSSRNFFGNESASKEVLYTYKDGKRSECEGSEMLYISSKSQPLGNFSANQSDLHDVRTILVQKYEDKHLSEAPNIRERSSYIKQKISRPNSSYCEQKRNFSPSRQDSALQSTIAPTPGRLRFNCNNPVSLKSPLWDNSTIHAPR